MNYTEQYLKDINKIWNIIPNTEILNNKKVLITGSSGLIGSALADTLLWANRYADAKINIQLCGRDKAKLNNRFSCYAEGKDYRFIKYDLDGSVELDKMDFVIHLAGIANTSWYSEKPVETICSTISGIKNIIDFTLKSGKCRLLYVSSSEVYGGNVENRPYKETDYGSLDILNPRSCYPSGKRVAESLCASYKSEYGLDFVIVRPGHVYGPTVQEADVRASSIFPKEAASGNDITMKSGGEQLRSHCYVLDAVSAIITVLINGVTGEAYNISNNDSVSTIKQFAEEFASTGGVCVKYAIPSESEKRGYNMMQNSSLDSAKLEALGWRGLFDLSTGARHTIDMLREQL